VTPNVPNFTHQLDTGHRGSGGATIRPGWRGDRRLPAASAGIAVPSAVPG